MHTILKTHCLLICTLLALLKISTTFCVFILNLYKPACINCIYFYKLYIPTMYILYMVCLFNILPGIKWISSIVHTPLHTFTAPKNENSKYTSTYSIRVKPLTLLTNFFTAGCNAKASSTTLYPTTYKYK